MKIHMILELPETLCAEFLQMLRDFDTKHDPDHAGIVGISACAFLTGNLKAEEMLETFKGLVPMPAYLFVSKIQGEDAFTCPVCHMTSYNKADAFHGYCGNCHAVTGVQAQEEKP